MYMEIGESIHQSVCNALKEKKMLLFSEFKLPPIINIEGNLDVGGRIDALVIVNGKVRILEIKSCGILPKKPDEKHLQQAVNYSSLLGIPAVLFYLSRNVIKDYAGYQAGELAAVEFEVAPTEEESLKAIRTLTLSHFYLEEGILPEIPFKTKTPCKDCLFYNQCWVDKERFDNLSIITEQTRKIIESNATKLAKAILSPEEVLKRRNGVFKHIQRNEHASAFAKEFLKGSWENIF